MYSHDTPGPPPTTQVLVMHRPRPVAVLAVLAAATAMTSAAAGSSKGGFGRVTLNGVGPLRLGISTPADVRRFAGAPDRITQFSGNAKDYFSRFPGGGSVQYHLVNAAGGGYFGASRRHSSDSIPPTGLEPACR
jgi:hypothetical protein